jgi:uncharacterized membrane protein YbhN (UPF0104 family)
VATDVERVRGVRALLGRGGSLQVVVATLVALALFGYVIDIASHGDLLGGIGSILAGAGWIALALAIPYVALRALTWSLLLRQVGVVAPVRHAIAAFCAGELTKSLPLGVYLETYVLARLERLREREIVGAAIATTGLDVMVGTVTFPAAMVLGLPGHGWFRVLLVAIAGAWIVIYLGIWLVVRWWRPQDRPFASRPAVSAARIVTEAVRGAIRLLRPAVLRPIGTTAAYLAIYVVVLWLVLDAMQLGLDLRAAVSVVVITSLVNVILPIPIELGITEITGVGILTVFGVVPRDAAIAMLGYRILTTGTLTVVVLPLTAYLRTAYVSPRADAGEARTGPMTVEAEPIVRERT